MASKPPQPAATAPNSGSGLTDQRASASPTPQDEADVLSQMFARLDAEAPTDFGRSSSATGEGVGRAGPPADDVDDGDGHDDGGSDVGEVWEDAAEDLDWDAGDLETETWSIARLQVRRIVVTLLQCLSADASSAHAPSSPNVSHR